MDGDELITESYFVSVRVGVKQLSVKVLWALIGKPEVEERKLKISQSKQPGQELSEQLMIFYIIIHKAGERWIYPSGQPSQGGGLSGLQSIANLQE